MRRVLFLGAAGLLAVTLSGCGGKPSAVPSSNQQATAYSPAVSGSDGTDYQRSDDAPKSAGKSMWAANRTHTSEENALYQFTKNGRDFGASSESDYVTKTLAFIEHPPGDVETLDRRNGDRLLYDAKDNIFAVVSRDGAPRTMFKPRGGASYWQQQKTQESQRNNGGSTGGEQSQG